VCFSSLVIDRESSATGPPTLALIDKIEAYSRGITANERQTRFSIKAPLLIAAYVGNAQLAASGLDKDLKRQKGAACSVASTAAASVWAAP
jgi:hypothetical protein